MSFRSLLLLPPFRCWRVRCWCSAANSAPPLEAGRGVRGDGRNVVESLLGGTSWIVCLLELLSEGCWVGTVGWEYWAEPGAGMGAEMLGRKGEAGVGEVGGVEATGGVGDSVVDERFDELCLF